MNATASIAPANRIDARAVFLNGRLIWALFIIRMGAEKSVIYEHHFSVAVWECSSVVSDENKGRHTCRTGGDGGEGSTLRAASFAYETKRREHKTRAKPVTDRTQRFDLPMAFSRVLTVFSAFAWR